MPEVRVKYPAPAITPASSGIRHPSSSFPFRSQHRAEEEDQNHISEPRLDTKNSTYGFSANSPTTSQTIGTWNRCHTHQR